MAEQLYQVLSQARERQRFEKIGAEMTPEAMNAEVPFLIKKIDLAPNAAGNTYLFAWQNPEAVAIMIWKVVVRTTTAGGTALAVMDVDVVADATSNANTIFDGIDINATAVYSSDETGSGGNELPHVCAANGGASDWITGYEAANKAYANLVGAVYIFYTLNT